MKAMRTSGIAVDVDRHASRRPERIDPGAMAKHLVGFLVGAGLSWSEIALVSREMPASKSSAHRNYAALRLPAKATDE